MSSSSGWSGATGIRAAACSTSASAASSGYDHQQRNATLRSHRSARSGSPSIRIRSAIPISAAVRDVPDHSWVANSSRSHARRVRSPGLSASGSASRSRLTTTSERPSSNASSAARRQPGAAARRVIAELGGAGERRDRDRERAAPLGRGRRPLELARGRLVRPDDRGRAMPHAPVEVDDRRQRGVGGVARLGRSRPGGSPSARAGGGSAARRPTTVTSRASIAGSSVPRTFSPAVRASLTDARSLRAAISSSRRVGSGSSPTWAANACSSRAVSGSHAGSSVPGCSWAVASGSSTSASGLPAASASRRERTSGSKPGATESSSSAEAASSRPSSRSSGKPPPSKPSRIAPRIRIGSDSSRRATKASTSSVERSSQWASSTTITTGAGVATSLSTLSVASAIRNRSGVSRSVMPNAARTAWRCGGASVSRRSRTPTSSWCRPANGQPRLRLDAGRPQHPHAARRGRLGGGLQERGLADAGLAAEQQRTLLRYEPGGKAVRHSLRCEQAAAVLGQHGQQVMQAPKLPRSADEGHRPPSWRAVDECAGSERRLQLRLDRKSADQEVDAGPALRYGAPRRW